MNGFITNALWGWFASWPWYAHLALAVGAGLFLWGALAGLYSFASKLGGWKAGVGALIALGGVVAALWPRKRAVDPFPHPDGEPVHPRKGKAKAESKDWLRRPGEDAASWLDRMTKK